MVANSTSIDQTDADTVKAAGWSDEAVYDAITVCALFQFYNNWIDATGVSDMPEVGYEASGKRLASHGYWMESPPVPADERTIDPQLQKNAASGIG